MALEENESSMLKDHEQQIELSSSSLSFENTTLVG